MREGSLKVYEGIGQKIAFGEFEGIASDPPRRGGLCIIKGRKSCLLTYAQYRLFRLIWTELKLCVGALSKKAARCPFARQVSLSEDKPLLGLLREVRHGVRSRKRGLSCRLCGACDDLSSLRIMRLPLRELAPMLRPQPLPASLPCIGSLECLIPPYSIYLVKRPGRAFYIPILEGASPAELLRAASLVRRLRRIEADMLAPPFSIELGDVIEERRKILRSLASLGGALECYALYSSVGLEEVLPLLIDENVGEFYVDYPGSFAYIDHRTLGRCESAVWVSLRTMERILAFAASAAGRSADYLRPSVRASVRSAEFHVRISVDAPPLSFEGMSMDVRKFYSSPLTMEMLISNGTITSEAASYLLGKLKGRVPITIYGESGSGKTTLAIALDLETPAHWRKYSVESDIAENVTQHGLGKHQVRLLTTAGSEFAVERRKEVLDSLLHKSPDYVFFGEVLSELDSRALFQLLASGIPCIHTVHAGSGEALLRRFVNQHRINHVSLLDLGVLVQMRRFDNGGNFKRRVVRVSELVKDNLPADTPALRDLFTWSDESFSLEPTSSYQPCFLAQGERKRLGEA